MTAVRLWLCAMCEHALHTFCVWAYGCECHCWPILIPQPREGT
jgi:hypothetical protein